MAAAPSERWCSSKSKDRLAKQTGALAIKCPELDMRLTRLETKSEMLEKLAPGRRRTRKKLEN